MRRSYRLPVLFTAAAVALAGLGIAAAAAEFPRHVPASSWRHHGVHSQWHKAGWHHHPGQWRHGRGHHRNRFHDGLVRLPTLPILIEAAPEGASYGHPAYRAPGVPDAVPYVHAGPRFAAREGSYVPAFHGGYGDVYRLSGSGTYAGDIEVVRDPGNGTFIAFYGGGSGISERPAPVPRPKIIHVTPETGKAACRMEAGVCVIRP